MDVKIRFLDVFCFRWSNAQVRRTFRVVNMSKRLENRETITITISVAITTTMTITITITTTTTQQTNTTTISQTCEFAKSRENSKFQKPRQFDPETLCRCMTDDSHLTRLGTKPSHFPNSYELLLGLYSISRWQFRF